MSSFKTGVFLTGLFCLLLPHHSLVSAVDGYCYSTDKEEPSREYASKTTYSNSLFNITSDEKVDAKCEAKQVYLITRHGTRYPKASVIKAFRTKLVSIKEKIGNQSDGQNTLCKEDKELIQNWQPIMNESQENELVPTTGHDELFAMGRRLKSRYHFILNKTFCHNLYDIRVTNRSRTSASAAAFGQGLFDNIKDWNCFNTTAPQSYTPVIDFFQLCHKYQTGVDNNDTAIAESLKFRDSDVMKDVIKNMSTRIGVNLTYDDVRLIYSACRFEYAIDSSVHNSTLSNRRSSPWCAMLTREDLRVLEFDEDLKKYYDEGPAYPVTSNMTCPFFKDLFKHMKSAVANETNYKLGVFNFAHLGTILPILSKLGLFENEEPLLATNYNSQADRKWRTSKLGPFAASVAFVLYDCGDSGQKVATLVQEKLFAIPQCNDGSDIELLCPYDKFNQIFGKFAEECDFNSICENNDTSMAPIHSGVSLILLTVIAPILLINFINRI